MRLVLALLAVPAFAQYVTVSGTLYNPNAPTQQWVGRVTVFANCSMSYMGISYGRGSQVYTVNVSGSFSIPLVPNLAATVTGCYGSVGNNVYNVEYQPFTGGARWKEMWAVPSSPTTTTREAVLVPVSTSSGGSGGVTTPQAANYGYFGPVSGSPAVPAFRRMVRADFPTSGATAGTYINPTVTVGADGIISSIANGSPVSGGSSSALYQQTFTSQTSVTIAAATHGFGTNPIIATVYDSTGVEMDANKSWNSSTGALTVSFEVSSSGRIVIVGAGSSSGSGSGDLSSSGSYANPSWITSLSYLKLIDVPSTFPPATHTHSDLVPNTRTITAGTGLTGGGDLSANRTLTLSLNGGTDQNCLGTDKATGITAAGILTCGTDQTGSAGGGITSLNGLTAATQTFALGTSGTDAGWSSATSTHTLNLPSASGTNRGLLTSADWSTFNSKQNAISGAPGTWPSTFTPSSHTHPITDIQAIPANTILGNNTGSSAVPVALTLAQIKTFLALTSSDVGLGNVDNTSDATKNAAAVTLTNKTLTTPVIGSYTVAGLPAAGTAGRVAVVTDASTAGDCTTGGGSALALCRDSGAAWVAVGDGGSGGGSGGTIFSQGMGGASIATATTTFGFTGAQTFSTTESFRESIVPSAITITDLWVRLNVAQPGTGTLVVTVRKNGVDTGLVLTIAAGAAIGSYGASGSEAFAAGDRISVKFTNNAAASAGIHSFAVKGTL